MSSGGAATVLLDPNANPDRRQAALEKAALRPAIHAQLWKLWGGKLPDDTAIRRYLVRQRKFNPSTVSAFIEVLKETVEFAGLASEKRVDGDAQPVALESGEAAACVAPNGSEAQRAAGDMARTNTASRREVVEVEARVPRRSQQFTFSLAEGEVVLQWPERMSEASFKDFETRLLFIIQMAKCSVVPTIEQLTGGASDP